MNLEIKEMKGKIAQALSKRNFFRNFLRRGYIDERYVKVHR